MVGATRNRARATGVIRAFPECLAWGLFLAALAIPWRPLPAQDAPPLRWGADAEGGAPYLFKDPQDPTVNVGFEVDLIAALSQRLNRPIEFEQYNYDSLVPGLERGDFDLAMNGLEVTPDRAARLRFSRPYYVYHLQLVVRADDSRLNTLEDCRAQQAVVGTLGETAASRLLEQREIASKIYDSQAEPYKDLELGRIDAVLMDLPIALYYAQPNPRLKLVGPPLNKGLYAIAFRRDQESLARQFDEALLTLAQDGTLRAIYEKWHLWNDDQSLLSQPNASLPGGASDPTAIGDVLGDTGRKLTFAKYFPLLVRSAIVTIEVSVLSMSLAMALGLLIAMARLYGPVPLRWLAVSYVEFFRGIPVLLLLYLLYYAIPSLLDQAHWGISFKPTDFTVAILAFGLNYAAYEAEIYRGGLSSIPVGQWEAAASLGMSRVTTFRRVILPQALRVITPPVTNDFVALFKDTSLVSTIGIIELTKQYQMLSKSSLKYLEVGLVTACLYLLMSVPLGYLARRLEQRWGSGH